MRKGSEVVALARGWIGTPWHHQGRLKGVGVDCIGLVTGVAGELGIEAPHIADYGRRPDDRLLREGLDLNCRRVRERHVGDILLFLVDGVPQHVGFASDIGVIHAHAGARRVVETVLGHWEDAIVGVFRLPD